jgi:hypothetical protein
MARELQSHRKAQAESDCPEKVCSEIPREEPWDVGIIRFRTLEFFDQMEGSK